MAYVKHILNLRGKICLKNKTYFQPYSTNILIVCINCMQTLVYRTFRFVCVQLQCITRVSIRTLEHIIHTMHFTCVSFISKSPSNLKLYR